MWTFSYFPRNCAVFFKFMLESVEPIFDRCIRKAITLNSAQFQKTANKRTCGRVNV